MKTPLKIKLVDWYDSKKPPIQVGNPCKDPDVSTFFYLKSNSITSINEKQFVATFKPSVANTTLVADQDAAVKEIQEKWEMKLVSSKGVVIDKDDYIYHMVELTDDRFSLFYNYTGKNASPFVKPRDLNITIKLENVSKIWSHPDHAGLNSTTYVP